MTQLLKDYLCAALGGAEARREMAERPYIRKLAAYDEQGKKQSVRELILSGDIEGTNLIQTEVHNTVVEGAMPMRAFFDVLPTVRQKGTTYKWPYGESGVYANKYAQGAEIAIRTQDYGAANYDASEVIGQRPLITDTMIESGAVDVIEEEWKFAAAAVQNTAERIGLTNILQGSGLEHDTAGSNQGLKAVSAAVTKAKAYNLIPDCIIMHADLEGKCVQDIVIPQSPGSDTIARGQGIPDGHLGLKWRVCGVVEDSSTYDWGYASDGQIGGLVLDSRRCGGIYLPRDLTVKEYDDPIHDMKGATVTMRADIQSHIANAAVRIEF